MEYTELRDYITSLDDSDHKIIDQRIAEKGIEGYLNQQLVYLDCSRVIQGMRMMQTIGYPYQREISSYLYALETVAGNDFDFDKEWINKLLERHQANLEYEKENPPVWYGGKKAKEAFEGKTVKTPRRRKSKEQTLPGMGKEVKAQATLKAKLAGCANIFFKIKPPKKD
jgi:hypothetical protein